MTNFTGTLTAVASTTVAATTIRTQMQTTIPANSAWSFIESTVIGASVTCDVYKCASPANGLSADFYVAVMQSAGNLWMGIAEGYNTSTHKPKRPALVATATAQTLQADGGLMPAATEIDWYIGTYNPGGGALGTPSSSMQILPAVTEDYIIAVAKDAVTLFVRTTFKIIYCGAYDTNVPTPATYDPLPIVISGSGGAGWAFATRMPMSGGQSRGYACNCNGRTSGDSSGGPLTGVLPLDSAWAYFTNSYLGAPANDQYDRYWQTPGVQAMRVPIFNSYTDQSAVRGRDLGGWLRGWFRHFRYIQLSSTASAMDTCTVDGVSYTFTTNSTQGIWLETNPT